MYENFEGLNSPDVLPDTMTEGLTSYEADYIREAQNQPNTFLVDRIDEFCDSVPPKAIDANRDIANLIEPVRDSISPEFLEAPSDSVQIENITAELNEVSELKEPQWSELSVNEKQDVLQNVENRIAELEHRPPCNVVVENLGKDGTYGYFSSADYSITLNTDYLYDNKETMDTLVHEGRHAYQEYNMNIREVHPRGGEVENWRANENYGYIDAGKFGFELYALQPLEADASAFANDVLKEWEV